MDGHSSLPSTSSGVANNEESSHLTTFDGSFVSVIGEQLGSDLLPSSSALVAKEVSTLLGNVLRLARKFQRSARRKWLASEDLEAALAYYGHNNVVGYEPIDGVTFRSVGKLGRELFVREDPELELSTLVNAPPPKLPLEPSIKAHWLVINGVQPSVSENPLPPLPKDVIPHHTTTDSDQAGTSSIAQSRNLSLGHYAKSMRKTEQVQIKSTTTHSLSLEQQVFFLKIMESIMGPSDEEQKRIEALNCLQSDCGLRTLLPRFSVAITEGVRCNIVVHNMAILVYLMRMIQALSQNPTISLEPCLHELLPAIMSCVLSRQLSANQQTSDTHCVLREFSSDLLAQLLKRYRLPHIYTRVIKTLSRAFADPNCPLPTLYGAAYALCELGTAAMQRVIVPNIGVVCAAISRVHTDKLYINDRTLAERFYNKMVEKLTALARDPDSDLSLHSQQDFISVFGGFGDDIYVATRNRRK